jgi:hypothetical protein
MRVLFIRENPMSRRLGRLSYPLHNIAFNEAVKPEAICFRLGQRRSRSF